MTALIGTDELLDRIEELEGKLLGAGVACYMANQSQLAAEAKLEKAVEALKECEDDIDAYIQFQYPHDHPVQERCRQQYYATNPARVALAELKGETE